MKEYINRNVAEQAKPEFLNEKVEDHEKAIYAKGWNDCNTQYRENILSIPASDVVEVRHGRWVNIVQAIVDTTGYCDKCHSQSVWRTKDMAYEICPHCGAEMDGGSDDGKAHQGV